MPSDSPPDWVLQRRRQIGARIRDARTWRNLTQEQLAERCGLDRKTIYRIELGTVSPRLDRLLVIAHALGVPAADLFR